MSTTSPTTTVDPDDAFERKAQVARAKIARTSGGHGRDPEANIEARREYAALQLERAISRAIEGAPPLDESQRARLHALLNADR